MATRRIAPPWDYLHDASGPSLESFELSRLNHAANLRREIAALLDQWIEETAQALLARWVREDRKLAQQPHPPPDSLPQIELPFSEPQAIAVPTRHSVRRIRASRRATAL
jgi:hypothetical protein